MHFVDLAGCALITFLALLGIISPQRMYGLSYKMGNDNHRRWSPQRRPLYFRMVRVVAGIRKQFLIVVTDAAQRLALDSGRCVQILREAGHLDTKIVSCCVDLGKVPGGLDAAELKGYLREHGVARRSV